MKRSILTVTLGGGFGAVVAFLLLIFMPMIPTERYSMSVDPIIVRDAMGTETHVAIKNTGTEQLTNITVYYGGTAKSDTIPVLGPGERVSLSPPDGSQLDMVRVTSDHGINITKEYRTPASADFVGNSGYGG